MSFIVKNKKIFWYIIYFVLITIGFLFYAFPSESVEAYFQALAKDRLTGSDLSLENVSLSLPFGWKLHQAELIPKEGRKGLKLKAEGVYIQPDPWSFIKGKRIYQFEGQIYKGKVKGSIDFIDKKTGPPYSLRMTLSDIDFKSGQVFQGMGDRDLEGQLNGTLQYEAKSDNIYDGAGEAELMLSRGKTEVTLPLFNLDTLVFDRLVVKCQLKNGKLNLGQLEFNGPDIKATLSGSIILNRQGLLKSRLNLKGEITPLPEFFQKLGDNPSSLELLKKRLKGGKLTFMVSGTLDEPRMRIT